MLKNVREKHRAIIDSFQPYHRINPDRDPLAILRSLRDAYEHREIATARILVERPSTDLEEIEQGTVRDAQFRFAPMRAPLTDDAEILGVRFIPDPHAKVKVDIQARFDVGFEPAHATMHDLDRIRRHVEEIVRRFEPVFPS
jgi:hypothetical protein